MTSTTHTRDTKGDHPGAVGAGACPAPRAARAATNPTTTRHHSRNPAQHNQ
jgi:hypothetical protein